MNDVIKMNLVQLYSRKGEIITEMESLQRQLGKINQQIFQLKDAPPKPKAEAKEE